MGNVNMEASQINYRGGESKMSVEEALKQTSGEAAAIATLQTAVGNLQTGKTDLTVVAPAFSDAVAYAVGALVTYKGVAYRCTTAHEGEWDADDFKAITISNELDELKSGLNGLLKYKVFDSTASDTTNHLYSTDVPASQYVCVGGCTPYDPNFCIQVSNIQVTSTGFIRYRLYDVVSNQVVSDNKGYTVYLVFVDTSMLSELVITP